MANLITLAEYKIAKGINKSEQDSVLEMLITNASAIIQSYIGRDLVGDATTQEDVFLCACGPTLFLDIYPIDSLTSVEVWIDGAYALVDPTSYYVDLEEGKVTKYSGSWTGRVRVSYRLDSVAVETVEAPLKQATIDLVTYYLKEEYKDSKSMRGATINNNTGSGNRNISDTSFPPHIQRVLNLFK